MLAALAAWMLPGRAQVRPGPELTDAAAAALASLIETARQQVIADGVRAVPASVKRSLLGYFPSMLLQQTRFASGRNGTLTLPALAFSYGDVAGLTLGDVVLFKTERVAQADLRLWAHELTHVMQYQRWGIEGFADHYVRDSGAVEQEAIDNATRFVTWLEQSRS